MPALQGSRVCWNIGRSFPEEDGNQRVESIVTFAKMLLVAENEKARVPFEFSSEALKASTES